MNKKDKQIIDNAEATDTPIFVLTAKDQLSIQALTNYRNACVNHGCDPTHIEDVHKRMDEFIAWQLNNPTKVKIPD